MNIKEDSFFLLIKPEDNIYSNASKRNSFFEELENLVKLGLKNIEISWSNNCLLYTSPSPRDRG